MLCTVNSLATENKYCKIGTTIAILIYKVLPYLVINLRRCSSNRVKPNNEFVNESGPVMWLLNLSYLHVHILYTRFAYGWERSLLVM